jgi:hypothetical protein
VRGTLGELCSSWILVVVGAAWVKSLVQPPAKLTPEHLKALYQDHPGECTTLHNVSYKHIHTESTVLATTARCYKGPVFVGHKKTRLVVIQHGALWSRNTRNCYGRSDAASLFSLFLRSRPGECVCGCRQLERLINDSLYYAVRSNAVTTYFVCSGRV